MKLYKTIGLSVLALGILAVNSYAATAPDTKKEANINYIKVLPISVVNNPASYLNKNISFNAEFVGFSSLGLDYKPAFREPSKYISVLIRRDDVTTHTVPLSEMKIFMPRTLAEKHMDMEQGDKIQISGKVFSTALGDPWVDIDDLKVLTKKENKEQKA